MSVLTKNDKNVKKCAKLIHVFWHCRKVYWLIRLTDALPILLNKNHFLDFKHQKSQIKISTKIFRSCSCAKKSFIICISWFLLDFLPVPVCLNKCTFNRILIADKDPRNIIFNTFSI